MTNEEAIKVLLDEWKCIDRNDGINCDRKCESCDLVMDSFVLKDAYNMAIKALEYDDAKYHAEHGEVIVDKAVWEDAKRALEQSSGDLISRAEAINALGYDISIKSDRGLDEYKSVIKEMLCKIHDVQKANIEQLPSVKPQEPKWDRLFNWLNDMRYGIASDETVTDIDERHCREAQTDILDEIMEWLLKNRMV